MQDGFRLADQELQVAVIYRNRKTLEIRVLPAGIVRVVAPRGTTDRFIRNCLAQKAGWIRKKLAEAQARERLLPKREYTSGEVFLFLGEEVTLTVVGNALLQKATVRLDGQGTGAGRLIVETPSGDRTVIKEALEEWYKQKAIEVFTKRIEFYGDKIGKKPERIKLSNATKRWGSCTSRGTTLLNWRVVMAPARVIDYLVVHELSHLIHMNHSAAFWRQVAEVIPDYREQKDWLKKNGYKLLY
ncbi:MAG TPA: M48 family metallopeptidase [Firmicutes bacterium]|nr:M48 family metallopeptidase [Bacillota bacterium]